MTVAQFMGAEYRFTLNAVNYAIECIGQIFWDDGGTHTVDTSGSSSIGWRTSSNAFTSGSTTVLVGIAPVDASNGTPGRASNSSNVISFDVAASFLGNGGGITSNAWQESVPTTGSKTMAHGDLVAVAVQMTARGATDSVSWRMIALPTGSNGMPTVTQFNGSTYSTQGVMPNVTVRASDGTRGYIFGGHVASAFGTTTINNGSATREMGNLFQVPYPCKLLGIISDPNLSSGADFDMIVYSDPLGTPASIASASTNSKQIGGTSLALHMRMFASPPTLAANTNYGMACKPTTANNVALSYMTFGNVAHQTSIGGGANGYAITRGSSGAFAAQNSSLDRYFMGVMIAGGDSGIIYPRSGLQAISEGMSR
jgi:hypothetical protein